MTAEEFYEIMHYPNYDKFDKKVPKFDYYDMLDFAEAYHKQEIEANVIPHIIPDDLYLLIAEAKAKRYGLGFEHIELQGAYSDGQCDTIDIIEKWFKNKLLKQ